MNPLIEKISDAEAEIMKVLWGADQAVPFTYIRTALQEQDKAWESPTVNTLVNRLLKKGVIVQEKRDVFYYTPLVSEEEYTEYKTKTFVRKIFGGNARNLLSALVSYREVTEEDLTMLKAYLEKGGGPIE